jgi:hypothetical protein
MSTPTVPLERHVRSRDPETSWEAAQLIDSDQWPALLHSVLDVVKDIGPATDDEIHAEYHRRGYPQRSPQRIRTARKSLTLGGACDFGRVTKFPPAIEAAESTGRSKLGHASQHWQAIEREEVPA